MWILTSVRWCDGTQVPSHRTKQFCLARDSGTRDTSHYNKVGSEYGFWLAWDYSARQIITKKSRIEQVCAFITNKLARQIAHLIRVSRDSGPAQSRFRLTEGYKQVSIANRCVGVSTFKIFLAMHPRNLRWLRIPFNSLLFIEFLDVNFAHSDLVAKVTEYPDKQLSSN